MRRERARDGRDDELMFGQTQGGESCLLKGGAREEFGKVGLGHAGEVRQRR